MTICSACGTENRDGAKFCQACGAPLVEPVGTVPVEDMEARELIVPPEVGALPPGTLLQGRYEVLGLVTRQDDRAIYRAADRRRCPACGAETPPAESFCPACGADLARLATCLLHEWLAPPSPPLSPPMGGMEGGAMAGMKVVAMGGKAGEGAEATFEVGGHTFAVAAEEPAAEELPFGQGVWLTVGLRSEKGPEREVNQDSLLALVLTPLYEGRPTPALGLFAVADGMGGHQTGEVASRRAVQTLAQGITSRVLMAELSGESCLAETLTTIVGESVEDANAQVCAVAQSSGAEMGSTLTVALVRDDLAIVASVGDSRTYHWHAGALRQVTTDHSVVERLLATGQIAPEEAVNHPQQGVLYRSLGDRPAVEVDVFSLSLAPGDRLLLCCDGVWGSLGNEGLEEVMLLEHDPQRICDEVVRRALESGATDNVSVIVVSTTGSPPR